MHNRNKRADFFASRGCSARTFAFEPVKSGLRTRFNAPPRALSGTLGRAVNLTRTRRAEADDGSVAADAPFSRSPLLYVQELVLVGPEGHHVDLFGEFEDTRNGEASGDHVGLRLLRIRNRSTMTGERNAVRRTRETIERDIAIDSATSFCEV